MWAHSSPWCCLWSQHWVRNCSDAKKNSCGQSQHWVSLECISVVDLAVLGWWLDLFQRSFSTWMILWFHDFLTAMSWNSNTVKGCVNHTLLPHYSSLSLLPFPPLSVCISLQNTQLSPVSQVWCCPTPLLRVLFAKVPNSPLTFSGCPQLGSGVLSSGSRDGSRGWLWVSGVVCLTCPISAGSQSTGSSWRARGAKAQPCSFQGRGGCWRWQHSGTHCSHRQVNTHLHLFR